MLFSNEPILQTHHLHSHVWQINYIVCQNIVNVLHQVEHGTTNAKIIVLMYSLIWMKISAKHFNNL